MKKVVLALSIVFGMAFTFAQTTVSGTVVDDDGNPVPGANVVAVGTTDGAVADFDGNYTLTTDKTPPFSIRISSIGFSDRTAEVTAANQTVNVTLRETSTLLDEIVISASRTPERIFESPVSVERFGLKEIKNTSAPSFYDGLQNLKGVDINTNSLTFQSLNTRGFATFANVRFMQLVDGMDNTAPGLNFVLGNLVGMNELDVQSVEILPGASSALYGAGAFNGILFMQSKNPFDFSGVSGYAKTGLTSQEAAGDNTYYDIGARIAHKFSDKFAAKFNISYLNGEDWHAVRTDDVLRPGADRTNPGYNGLNVYGDEVATTLNFDAIANANAGLPVAPGTFGSAFISRTGYDERDLANYNAESLKLDASLNWRPTGDDLEVILNLRRGQGTTIYQGANRYSVSDFTMTQSKLEIKNDNFFIRGYIVSEDSGDSYDTRFAAINVNRSWKSDLAWFGDYAGTFIGSRLAGQSEEASHAAARTAADTGRLIPGTPEFQSAFDAVVTNGNLDQGGARFVDETKFRHINGNYNLAHLIDDWADIQVGGSWRQYELASNGTIFTDTPGNPIKYSEFGAYAQLQKKFADERVKLTLSTRYDKNEFFDGFLSPRAGISFTLGEERNHNLRFSVQKGFRNPTTQDLFIGLDVGAAILVGSAPENLDKDTRTYNVSQAGQNAGQPATVDIVGRAAYENSFNAVTTATTGIPTIGNPDIVKPEEITAYEVGYRAQLGKFTIDASGYYNQYNDFISTQFVLVPLYGNVTGSAQEQGQALQALQNGDTRTYQAYTNSPADINSYGATIGVDTKVFGNYDLGVNYTYAKLDFDAEANPGVRTNFNTPEHRFKASFGNTEVVKNLGFGINYRWSDDYFWEASFGDGQIDSFSVLDAQVNYSIPSIDSVIKLGGSNILGDEYVTAFGTGNIGSIYYISLTWNP